MDLFSTLLKWNLWNLAGTTSSDLDLQEVYSKTRTILSLLIAAMKL